MILEHIKLLYENLFLNTINYSGLWGGGVGSPCFQFPSTKNIKLVRNSFTPCIIVQLKYELSSTVEYYVVNYLKLAGYLTFTTDVYSNMSDMQILYEIHGGLLRGVLTNIMTLYSGTFYA